MKVRRQDGQASLEFLGAVPLVLLVAALAAQLLAVGYSSVLAGNAAEAGALAVAGGADPRTAVHAALPGWARARGRIELNGGRVTVRLRPPTLLRALGRRLEVRAHAVVGAP